MDGHPRLISESSLCDSCPLAGPCGAELTDKACPENWFPEMPGGAAVTHPLKPGTLEELAALGGPEFHDIVAAPVEKPALPPYTPQPRNRTSLRGYLNERVYAVRARDVIKAKHVIAATELRDRIGLEPWQQLILVPFDRDEILEDMWGRGGLLIWQLAEAGYDLVVAPSFSTYTPRPRTEFMINTRRSMLYFRALQDAGAPAIARVAWQVSADARRFAAWAIANRAVELVAIDWSTYRGAREWREQLEGLAIFEARTEGAITYFVSGVTTERRCDELFSVVPPERVRVTNATTQARIAVPRLRPTGDRTGATFADRCAKRRGVVVRSAARAAERGSEPAVRHSARRRVA